MARLEFWFDFASTYSYLTAMRIEPLAKAAGVEVRWMPFLLGPVFKQQGWNTSPFNIYEDKGRYMWRDVTRQADAYGLAFRRPQEFPQFALTATRVAVAAGDEPWLTVFCRKIFHAEYGEGRDITAPEAVAAALETCGQDAAHWLQHASQAETKQTLRKRVEHAFALGMFGAPSFVCENGELFWGDDRLEQAIAWTAGNQADGTSPS